MRCRAESVRCPQCVSQQPLAANAPARVKLEGVSCLICKILRPVRGPYLQKENGDTNRLNSIRRCHKLRCLLVLVRSRAFSSSAVRTSGYHKPLCFRVKPASAKGLSGCVRRPTCRQSRSSSPHDLGDCASCIEHANGPKLYARASERIGRGGVRNMSCLPLVPLGIAVVHGVFGHDNNGAP